jgi:hypothetical protein
MLTEIKWMNWNDNSSSINIDSSSINIDSSSINIDSSSINIDSSSINQESKQIVQDPNDVLFEEFVQLNKLQDYYISNGMDTTDIAIRKCLLSTRIKDINNRIQKYYRLTSFN